jgi:hypothetical protein
MAALNSFLCNDVGQDHSPLETNDIGARRNALYNELPTQTVITDAAGFPLAGNQMQLPAPVAHDPTPH